MMRRIGTAILSTIFLVSAIAGIGLVLPTPAASGPAVSGTVSALQGGPWNVGITGTPSVNVANVPAVSIAGNLGVTVENTPSVIVGNTEESPVPIRNIDGKTPARFGPSYVYTGSTSDYPEVIPEVPAGKTFIITSINISGFTPNPDPDLTSAACTLALRANNSISFAARVGLEVGFQGFATANVQTYLPLNAGEGVGVGCGGTPFNNNSQYGITFGGYFVTAP